MNSISNIIVFITIWFQFINSYIWLKLHIVFLVLLSFITWKHCHLQNLSLDFILTVILHWHSPHSLNISIINFQTISILSFTKISMISNLLFIIRFSSPELKVQVSFSDQNLSVVHCCCRKLFTFSSSSPEPPGQFQPDLTQSILGWRGLKFFKWRTPPFSKGR